MLQLTSLLHQIKENPNYFLGKPSITCLDSFLRGYLMARTDMGLQQIGLDLREFHTWIKERLEMKTSQSWLAMILFDSGNERSGFYRFFDLFAEFQSEKRLEAADYNDSRNQIWDEDFYDFLKSIRRRPAMYLGTSSITRLYMLLKGYDYARREAGVTLTDQEQDFLQFQEWVQARFDIHSPQSWDKIILFHSIDEQEALKDFFELLDEFLSRKLQEATS
ncbi:hypothetical protein Cylst_6129 [Cylindrospermum stagnale PCC 7417]|uniref:Uncharacterized protein n=1 Tax=Cylindrospermum stagnale PCC 7417 TaxID=56107 RepID=K9X8X6_9NOST|nr:hypothetical protein [Cylindrospermum stagnale]AFZ28097.1 hypothetical protein Cylst_6129 [Cylindrospermum stagnale PCC 7417]